jgi:predicted amidohydrolase YtcJ
VIPLRPGILLVNGNVYTLDPDMPRAEAIAISGRWISAVGTNEEVMALTDAQSRVIDLQGKTVLPGFIDSHVHFLSYALQMDRIDLTGAKSKDEVVAEVREAANREDGEGWILGRGWDCNRWEDERFPCREDLDAVAPDTPVALTCKDGHTLWVNTVALKKASIDRFTPDPQGGKIEKNPDTDEPTGILREKAKNLLQEAIPEPTRERTLTLVLKAVKRANQLGLTGLHDCEGKVAFDIFQRLKERGHLSLRIYMMIPQENLDAAITLGVHTGFGDDMLRIGPVKIFADGALGSCTAAMHEAYASNPDNFGFMVTGQEEMAKTVYSALSNGLDVAVHAIGDRANQTVLRAYETVVKQGSFTDRLLRIEHAQHMTLEDIHKFAELGIVASMQPTHIALDMDIADTQLGSRSVRAYRLRTLSQAGVDLAFGSDCPVVDLNPLLGIYTAVTRSKPDGSPRGGWYPEERMPVLAAIEAFTLGAAKASGESRLKGSIASGKYADIIVLSKNIVKEPSAQILETQVIMTMFNGRFVHNLIACS